MRIQRVPFKVGQMFKEGLRGKPMLSAHTKCHCEIDPIKQVDPFEYIVYINI